MKPIIKRLKGSGKKKVLLLSGVHGEELTPLAALNQLHDRLPKTCYKSITFIFGVNIPGITQRERNFDPPRSANVNRMLTLDSYSPTEMLKKEIDKHDIVIDVHSSPSINEFVLFDKDEYAKGLVAWCNKAKVKYACRYSVGNTIKKYCLALGKTAITLELNALDVIDFDSAKKGALMVQRLLVAAPAKIKKEMDYDIPEIEDWYAPESGIIFVYSEIEGKNDVRFYISDLTLTDKKEFRYFLKEETLIAFPKQWSWINRGEIMFLTYEDLRTV